MHGADESLIILLLLALVCIVVLPIVALVRTMRIGRLERRMAGVEAALRRVMREVGAVTTAKGTEAEAPVQVEPEAERVPQPPVPPEGVPAAPRTAPQPASTELPPVDWGPQRPQLEEIIGQRWLGWIAVFLILFGAAFFLKYAFENRWIGELGRVIIGISAGLGFAWAGWRRHLAGWRYFSRVLTAGGVILIYLSIYASFGFYRLVDQRVAFAFLVLVVVQAHLVATAYNSRAIALVAQIGGFLVPILLSTGRDQYVVLFCYISVLNIGVVILSIVRAWRWVGTCSFVFTHFLFWAWYVEHYHFEKLAAAITFQIVVFVLFLMADLTPQYRSRASSAEEWARLFTNPFVFFATAYHLLEADYPEWMGAFALVMATLYAVITRAGMGRRLSDRRALFVLIGVALTFVTVAIPIQLESNWITIGWAAQGAIMVWLSPKMKSQSLRIFSAVVFGLAIFRHLAFDTPWSGRGPFNPVGNRYFLGALALVALLFLAAYLYREVEGPFVLTTVLAALGLFWLAMSVETYTYYDTLEGALPPSRTFEEVRQIRWTGQMVLSVLWSLYAAGLVAAGFRLRKVVVRWAGLFVFGVTVLKVVFVDISQVRELYRVIAFLALGGLLLVVAWGYQRILRREQSS